MPNVFGYKQQVRGSEQQQQNRQQLAALFQQSPLPTDQLLSNLGLYVRSSIFARFLFLDELFRKILPVPGDIVEFGTWWGQSLVTFLNLRAVYEPYSPRRIIGFDTFTGYPEPGESDRSSDTIKRGGYTVSERYQEYLSELLEFHERENVLAHIKKFELVVGDVSATVPEYFENRPEAIVALAFFDMALYQPTKIALQAIKDRLVKGSILAFDELADADSPGETQAVREVLGLRSFAAFRSRYLPTRVYFVVE
jgi:Macrocin-O-methyltransferase (TylF)